MAQINDYKQTIHHVLTNYMKRFDNPTTPSNIQTTLLIDDERGNYAILRHGWQGKQREQHVLVLMRLEDGRIWLEEDWTDYDFAGYLLEAGIPNEDIVLAFHHPSLRPYATLAQAA
jgi:hypothetical protein